MCKSMEASFDVESFFDMESSFDVESSFDRSHLLTGVIF
jgi:hypothetical protein